MSENLCTKKCTPLQHLFDKKTSKSNSYALGGVNVGVYSQICLPRKCLGRITPQSSLNVGCPGEGCDSMQGGGEKYVLGLRWKYVLEYTGLYCIIRDCTKIYTEQKDLRFLYGINGCNKKQHIIDFDLDSIMIPALCNDEEALFRQNREREKTISNIIKL